MRPGLTRAAVLGCCLALALPTAATAQPGSLPRAAEAAPGGDVGVLQESATGQAAGSEPTPVEGSGSVAATRATVPAAVANARIASVLRTRTQSSVLGSHFTATVLDATTGKYVYTKRSTVALRGASTTKILTSVVALQSMGAARRLPTTVKAGATPADLILTAGGDPLLTSADLRALAASTKAKLKAMGHSLRYSYRLTADDTLFSGDPISRGWSSGWVPSEVRPVGAFTRDDRKVRDSTKDAASYFAAQLRRIGVKATYRGRATAAPKAATLAAFSGHTVGEAVSRALLISDNDTAEMLFRLSAVANKQPGTWAGARKAQAAVLHRLGVPLAKVRIVDGSGLSLEGRLTAPALTTALTAALSAKHPRLAPLRSYLPVAGRTGTLQASYGRFTTKPSKCAAGLIQAKTGTLADSIALAGYAQGADGATKVFVSIVNSRPTRYTRQTTRKAVDKVASSVTGCW